MRLVSKVFKCYESNIRPEAVATDLMDADIFTSENLFRTDLSFEIGKKGGSSVFDAGNAEFRVPDFLRLLNEVTEEEYDKNSAKKLMQDVAKSMKGKKVSTKFTTKVSMVDTVNDESHTERANVAMDLKVIKVTFDANKDVLEIECSIESAEI